MAFVIKSIKKREGNQTSSNKHQTLPENTDPNSLTVPAQAHSKGTAPQPFIDRIVITVTVPTVVDGIDMHGPHMTALKDVDAYVSKQPPPGYRRAFKIALESVPNPKKWPFYSFSWKAHSAEGNGANGSFITKLRLEFVPVDLGIEGMIDLHSALCCLMDDGWSYLLKHGRISRLDVAIDLPNVQMDQFLLMPKQQLTTTQWSSKGGLQSLQLGKPKGNHTLIYDRWAKRKGKGQPTAGKEGVRIERRLKDTKLKLTELPTLPFPFKEVAVEQLCPSIPAGEKKAYIWNHFMCAVKVKGLVAALGDLPPEKRTIYRKHLVQNKVDWWNPDLIWEGWLPMLNELKIADPAGVM